MTTERFTVVATFKIKEGAELQFEEAVGQHLPPHVEVPGLERFQMYHDPREPTRYMFHEDWVSEEAFQANAHTGTHASYLAATWNLWDEARQVGLWKPVDVSWETPA